MFRESFLHRRCVVPAAGFYEWNRAGEKAVFEPENKETLYFAGVYRMEKGVPRFVILTTQANESMVKIHDRMPLIIKEEQIEEWRRDRGFESRCLQASLSAANYFAAFLISERYLP